jgi:hypothetical protein
MAGVIPKMMNDVFNLGFDVVAAAFRGSHTSELSYAMARDGETQIRSVLAVVLKHFKVDQSIELHCSLYNTWPQPSCFYPMPFKTIPVGL